MVWSISLLNSVHVFALPSLPTIKSHKNRAASGTEGVMCCLESQMWSACCMQCIMLSTRGEQEAHDMPHPPQIPAFSSTGSLLERKDTCIRGSLIPQHIWQANRWSIFSMGLEKKENWVGQVKEDVDFVLGIKGWRECREWSVCVMLFPCIKKDVCGFF